MRDIAIIGAGELGASLAYLLARRDLAEVIHLIDDVGRVAEGKALDITQAQAVEGASTRVSGSSEWSSAGGAQIVVLADGAASGEWPHEAGVTILKRLARVRGAPLVICAGASQRGLVEYGVREMQMPRTRILGSAPDALASAARAMVALAVDGSARDVALTVLGIPPAHIVIPWEDATVGGLPLVRLLEEPARRRIAARIVGLWPPGPHALAAAAARAIEALTGRSRVVTSSFVAPDDSMGARMKTAALPVRLGPGGVERVVLPELDVVNRTALETAMLL
jgi:malate dehydrogenase